jgi:hypothetical protein
MATVPLSGTDISLYTGIPFSNDYKHTRWFDDITAQQTWFSSKTVVHQISESTFQRDNDRTFIRCDKSIDELRGVNYLKFRNTDYNNKWFYAFVTKLEYKNKSMTNVHFQIDVLQTWRFEMNFKPSFIEREHCPQYYSDGMPVMNTVDEGLDYGTEYDTVQMVNYRPYDENLFVVIVSKETMHMTSDNKVEPVVNGSIQPLTYYVHPVKLNGQSPTVRKDGTSVNLSTLKEVLKALYENTKAVGNIVSIYMTEYIGKDIDYDGTNDVLDFDGVNFADVAIKDTPTNIITMYVKDVQFYESNFRSLGDKYSGYAPVEESKLLMYPYTCLVLDDFKGNRVEYKNELIDSNLLNITVRGSMGTSNKTAYSVQQYLAPNMSGTDLLLHSLEHSLINNNPNDIPIVTDMLSAFLQGNKNQIQTQKDSAVFQGVNSVVGSIIGGVASAVTRNPLGVLSSVQEGLHGVGNSMLQMQGISSKQKDISNVPPQITKMGSNTAFDSGNGYLGCFVLKKQIKAEYRKKLTDFFKMFGYKVNEVKVPNFHTRRSWNYVKTVGCYIRGNFANEDLQELKSIFDNGITLWHHEDMGNYDLDNSEV